MSEPILDLKVHFISGPSDRISPINSYLDSAAEMNDENFPHFQTLRRNCKMQIRYQNEGK